MNETKKNYKKKVKQKIITFYKHDAELLAFANSINFQKTVKDYLKQFETIKKDLEVLEILKENNLLEYLIEKELFETANSYCGNTNKERERVKDYRNKLNKIKGWLKNE